MRYYCTLCGAKNLRAKTRSNYGCMTSLLDLLLFASAIATLFIGLWPISLLLFVGNVVIACSVKKTKICRKCKNENCLVPMSSPIAQAACGKTCGCSK